MILTCPECTTRYQADAAKFPLAGRDVRCGKCGHIWHQAPPEPEIEPEPVVAEPEPAPRFEPAPRPEAYVQAPERDAEPQEDAQAPSPWPRRLALGAGWLGLIAIILVIGVAAMHYRQHIVTSWPPSASLYSRLGIKVNASGLQFDNVKYREETQGGQIVLTVSGVLANVTDRELPVPQIRVGLTDSDKRELYHWTFVPDVMTLKPGQSTRFTTRLSSPPAATRHLDLRFAKAGE